MSNSNEKYSVKNASNIFLKWVGIAFGVTMLFAIMFMVLCPFGFNASKTVWPALLGQDFGGPGGGYIAAFGFFLGLFTLLAELAILAFILYLFAYIPTYVCGIILVINIIARLFQIGTSKKWKNIVTKIFLFISIIIEGLLCIYLTFLSVTGFTVVYLIIYAMLFINLFAFVKNILVLKNTASVDFLETEIIEKKENVGE